MSDFTVHDSCPEYAELDDKRCQLRGCDRLATHTTKFHAPEEFVVYCSEHAYDMLMDAGGKSVRPL